MIRSLIFFLLLLPSTALAQSFSAFLARVHSVPEPSRQEAVDSLLALHPTFPLADNDTTVYFLYAQPATSVALAGDMNEWNPAGETFSRVSTTSLWYLRKTYPATARLDYKLVVDGSRWILDPRNPRTQTGGFGPNSELRMPRHSPDSAWDARSWPHPGELRDTLIRSRHLGDARRITVYLPPRSVTGDHRCGIAVFQDGTDYLQLGAAVTTLDNLILTQAIRPVVALFVPPVDRTEEYQGSRKDDYARFLSEEAIPAIRASCGFQTDTAGYASIGASNGGNISLYHGITRPADFSRIAAQSSNVDSVILEGLQSISQWTLTLWLDVGQFDLRVLVPRVRGLADLLRQRNFSFYYREPAEGHSWGSWKNTLPSILRLLFPLSTTTVPHVSRPGDQSLRLSPYPNPCAETLTFAFLDGHIPETLSILTLDGRVVKTVCPAQSPFTLSMRGLPPMR